MKFPDRFLTQICAELEKSPKSLQDKDIMHKISNTVSGITQTIINICYLPMYKTKIIYRTEVLWDANTMFWVHVFGCIEGITWETLN